MTLRLPRSSNQPVQQVQFAERLLERLKSMPGVEAVAVSSAFPLTGVTDVGIRFEARPADLSTTTANYYRVTPGYFRVMQIPLIRGSSPVSHGNSSPWLWTSPRAALRNGSPHR